MFSSISPKLFFKIFRVNLLTVLGSSLLILVQVGEVAAQKKRMTLSTSESAILIVIILLIVALVGTFLYRRLVITKKQETVEKKTLDVIDQRYNPRKIDSKGSEADTEDQMAMDLYMKDFFQIHEAETIAALHQAVNNQSNNEANSETAKPRVLPVFEMLPPSAPVLPLPVLDEEPLLESIKKLQNAELNIEEREEALKTIVKFKARNAAEAIAQTALRDESLRMRGQALLTLGEFDHESVFEPILLSCADSAREVRAAAARALARLNINRTESFMRIIESKDAEQLRRISLACLEAGFAKQAFERLAHDDRKHSREAFAIVYLLVVAGAYDSVVHVLRNHADNFTRLATIRALQTIKPLKMLPRLRQIPLSELPSEVQKPLKNLIEELSSGESQD